MYNVRYFLFIVYVIENLFLFLKYIMLGVCISVCIYCICMCNRVYFFNLKKNNYLLEVFGGFYVIWNIMLNFKKKWCIKMLSVFVLYFIKC